jgi:signal transduction histidine kinase
MMGKQEPGHRVLLLHSEARLTPSVVSADQAFRSTLEARLAGPVYFYTEFLDLNSFHGASLQRALPELFRLKYGERPIDLIVAQGELSVPFVLQNRAELFSSAPVVFVAVEASTFADLSLASVATGTWRRRGWAETLDLACRLHPGTRRAVVIVGSSPGERFWVEAARQQLAASAGSIDISYIIDAPLEDVLGAVRTLSKDTVVLAGPFLRDGTGQDFATPGIISRLAAVSSVPIYGLTEASIGSGVVGGHVISFEAHGKIAAELALRVLAGERASPTEAGTTLPMFDDRQIKRWGIDRRRLPAGSVLLYREPSLWERCRAHLAWHLGLAPVPHRTHQRGDQRLHFEDLLLDLSAALSSCPGAEVDRQVEIGLRRIVEDLEMDRATIWALDDRSHQARLTHAWTRHGVPPLVTVIQESEAPGILSRLRRGDVVRIPPSGAQSDETPTDHETLARFGTRSSAVVPLVEGGSVVGGLSVGTVLEERDWPDELLARLRLLADIFANALARQRAARAAHESAEHIRDLAGRLMTSQEEERRRIARELHDGVNQDLAALSIALNALEDGLPEGTAPERRQEVARLQGRIVELTEAIRHLSHELHPGILQYGGLAAALRSHCREFEHEHGLTVTFQAGDDLGTVPPDVALCLYRVTQEALKNAARHAKPSRVWVALARDRADLVLTIGDDGCGFDLGETRGRGGLGLISLDERVRLVRGRLTIDTQPQRGTEVRVVVPLPEIQDAPPDDTAR